MNRVIAVPAAIAILLICIGPARATEHSYTETFLTTENRYDLNTTAWWDTLTGTLRLYPDSMYFLDQYNTPGYAGALALDGKYAYVADQSFGIQVLDVSDPSNITLAGSYNTAGSARSVAISGDYAYVADGNNGLVVLDISNPASPALVATLATGGYADDIIVNGDFVYIANTGSGLFIADIEDPTSPSALPGCDTPGYAISILLVGEYIFIADDDAGVQVIGAGHSAPEIKATWDVGGSALDIAVSGDYIYVALEEGALVIGDISDPLAPLTLSMFGTSGKGNAVCVAGDMCFYFNWLNGIMCIDVTDPYNPVMKGQLDTPGVANDGVLAGENVLIADGSYGLQSMHMWSITVPRSMCYDNFGTDYTTYYEAEARGDYLYIVSENGYVLFDISDPYNVLEVGGLDVDGATAIEISGDYAFVSGDDGLTVIENSDPESPSVVTTRPTSSLGATSCLREGENVFVGHPSGLDVFDITPPASAGIIGTLSLGQAVEVMAAAGDRLFATAGGSTVVVIDISDPTAPAQSGSYVHSLEIYDMAVHGDYLFCADEDGYIVLSIQNPDAPSLVHTDTYFGGLTAYDMEITGNLLIITDFYNRIHIHDITDPTAPVENIWTWDIEARFFTLQGDILFGVSGSYGRLDAIQMFNMYYDSMKFLGMTIPLPQMPGEILKCRVETPGSEGTTDCYVSVEDLFSLWETVNPGSGWQTMDYPGSSPQWYVKLRYDRSQGAAPTYVGDLRLDCLMAEPSIDMVADVPGDQGGAVRLRFARSAYDFDGETDQVESYTVWRRVDDGVTLAALGDRGTIGSIPVRGLGDRLFAESDRELQAAGFPAGTWEALGSLDAIQQDEYYYYASTIADSSETIPYAAFCVTAHSIDPSNWWASPVELGYSVDNIAPGVPTGFAVAYNTGHGNDLLWEESADVDFQYFKIYRGGDRDFVPSPENLVQMTAGTSWSDDISEPWSMFYKISSVDHAGNESAAVSPGTVTDAPPPLPAAYALHQNIPNPFNPSTTVRFDLPVRSRVRVAVYDVGGRLVRVLIDQVMEAGSRTVSWDGADGEGRRVASGVYFCRFETPKALQTRKMVLLR